MLTSSQASAKPERRGILLPSDGQKRTTQNDAILKEKLKHRALLCVLMKMRSGFIKRVAKGIALTGLAVSMLVGAFLYNFQKKGEMGINSSVRFVDKSLTGRLRKSIKTFPCREHPIKGCATWYDFVASNVRAIEIVTRNNSSIDENGKLSLSNKALKKSELEIVATVIHEAMHSYLFKKTGQSFSHSFLLICRHKAPAWRRSHAKRGCT